MRINTCEYLLKIIILIVSITDNKNNLCPNLVEAQQANINQTTATLSQARDLLAATSSCNTVFFGGGNDTIGPSDRVDIYNVTSGTWTTATLSVPRARLAAVSLGHLIFFAGGWDLNSLYYNQVDIYNVSDGSWSTASLSQARNALAATSVGNFVLFGGGCCDMNGNFFNVVDVYNVTGNAWTTATLSEARYGLAATSVANQYALFAGGNSNNGISNKVDIYDFLTEIWSTTTLSQARYLLAAASICNFSFFGGGWNGSQASDVIDIFNATTKTWSTATLSQARDRLAATSIGDIVAFGGGFDGSNVYSVVDMYNITNNMWFTATLSQPRNFLAATSSNNQLFFGGGQNDTYNTNAVDIFIIPSSMIPCSSSLSPQSPGLSTSSFPFSSSTQIPSTASPFISPATNSVVTSTSSSAAPHNASSTASTGVIVGILVAIVALLIGIGLILFFILFVKRRRQKNKQNQNSASSVSQTNIKTVNSTESDPNYVTLNRLSPQQQFQTETMAESSFFESTQVKLQYSQISFSELVVGNEIGEGSYGKVCLGKWNNAVVALKFCRKRGKEEEFMREVRLMIKLPPHPNVVQMFGISLDGPQPIIILEYCAEGSLDKILFDSNVKLDDEYKMRLVREIAAGMYHLHKHNIVHRDLAARNILLTSGGAPKISDFGMSRILEKTEEGKSLSNIGPIRWMAPESISQQTYSKKSDVWTFGIVVWEIVCQREPHTNVNPVEVGILIRDRYLTPTIPNNCPQKLRQVMELCWQKQPDQRPGFETICAMLQ